MKGGAVAVGVSGQQSFARFIKLPPVEAKKIPEIVRFEAIQQIPFPLDDVEWSYQLFQDRRFARRRGRHLRDAQGAGEPAHQVLHRRRT